MPFKITLTLLLTFFIFFIFSCKKNNPAPKPTPKETPVISGFDISTKYIGDSTFLVPKAVSNSGGAFTYSSSNAAVASIKGDSIQINGIGSVTITAMQAGATSYTAGSVTTSFKVLPSVYITGWSRGTNVKPMYWRNGIVNYLQGFGSTNGIFIYNKDIYITGGMEVNGYGYCGYWKNGVPHPLQQNAFVNGIAVLNGNVYAVGYTYDLYNSTAILWKNDVAIPLTNGLSISSLASAISIHNNAVYITGTSGGSAYTAAATIWKEDGSAVLLTNPNGASLGSTGYGITFQGDDTYISGSVSLADGNVNLGYWKNGTFFASTSPSHTYPNNTSIVLNGSDVYTAGIFAENNVEYSAYWKNGVKTILATNATARGIAFSGSDMYVVGTTITTSNFTDYPSPVYWFNGTLVKLPTPIPNNTLASSIFIRNQ